MSPRSLGDFAFKSPQPLLSAEPYVSTHHLEPSDHLVLLTSDGVTDVLPDDDMLDIGLRAIEQVGGTPTDPNSACCHTSRLWLHRLQRYVKL